MTPLDREKALSAKLAARVQELESDLQAARREARGQAARDVAQTIQARSALTGQEAWLLAALYAADGRVVTKAALNERLPWFWANREAGDRATKTIDVILHRIRRKMGADRVETIWHAGLRITPSGVALVDRLLAGENLAAASEPARTWPEVIAASDWARQ